MALCPVSRAVKVAEIVLLQRAGSKRTRRADIGRKEEREAGQHEIVG